MHQLVQTEFAGIPAQEFCMSAVCEGLLIPYNDFHISNKWKAVNFVFLVVWYLIIVYEFFSCQNS